MLVFGSATLAESNDKNPTNKRQGLRYAPCWEFWAIWHPVARSSVRSWSSLGFGELFCRKVGIKMVCFTHLGRQTFVDVYIYTYVHTYIYIYIYVYTYSYIRFFLLSGFIGSLVSIIYVEVLADKVSKRKRTMNSNETIHLGVFSVKSGSRSTFGGGWAGHENLVIPCFFELRTQNRHTLSPKIKDMYVCTYIRL